jgi:hypothetical protein
VSEAFAANGPNQSFGKAEPRNLIRKPITEGQLFLMRRVHIAKYVTALRNVTDYPLLSIR